jgi:hypothetical protein
LGEITNFRHNFTKNNTFLHEKRDLQMKISFCGFLMFFCRGLGKLLKQIQQLLDSYEFISPQKEI